jgi:hypothetical protein
MRYVYVIYNVYIYYACDEKCLYFNDTKRGRFYLTKENSIAEHTDVETGIP